MLNTTSSNSNLFEHHVKDLPFVYGGVTGKGVIRQCPEDFIVDEQLSFEPSGEGEHVFLQLKKTGLNTDSVAQTLAKFAQVKRMAVAYAGMKDRHAVTSQMFSVHLPGKDSPNWALLEDPAIKILSTTRHRKKLKVGAIKANYFAITVKDCQLDEQALSDKVNEIGRKGVPNYFMEQRFGHYGHNLTLAHQIFSQQAAFKSKRIKGLMLSAVRSYLFNLVLAKRVTNLSWDKALGGDAFILNGTRQFFIENKIDDTIVNRLLSHDIHPSGPLYGLGETAVCGIVEGLEGAVFDEYTVFCDGLVREKVDVSRRSLRVVPDNITLENVNETTKRISFNLPSGSYATAVLRELFDTDIGND